MVTTPQLVVVLVPASAGLTFLFQSCALMPGDEAIHPAHPAPPTILVVRAFQLGMPWVVLATLGTGGCHAFRTVKETHLSQLVDLLLGLHLHKHLNLALFMIGAGVLVVLMVAAQLACLVLLLGALLCLMSLLLATETADSVQVSLHEDWHLCWSLIMWCEWCGLWGVVTSGNI